MSVIRVGQIGSASIRDVLAVANPATGLEHRFINFQTTLIGSNYGGGKLAASAADQTSTDTTNGNVILTSDAFTTKNSGLYWITARCQAKTGSRSGSGNDAVYGRWWIKVGGSSITNSYRTNVYSGGDYFSITCVAISQITNTQTITFWHMPVTNTTVVSASCSMTYLRIGLP
jgi:hypothetical protein